MGRPVLMIRDTVCVEWKSRDVEMGMYQLGI